MSATANKVDFRRLELRDLNAIETIERASYPTPWSRSMFAGELAKPSSISLGAFEPDTRDLLGYLIISRYVDAWHVMNLAVAPEHRRKRIATGLLERLFELTGGEGRRGYTLEVRVSNDVAIRLYEQAGFKARGVRRGYYTDNREDALIMWRDFEPRPDLILGSRDVLRRDRCGGDHARTGRSSRTSSRLRPICTPATAESCPKWRRRRHLELVTPVLQEALRDAGAELDDVELMAVTAGPGLDRCPARRSCSSESDRVGEAVAAGAGRPPPGTHCLALSRAGPGRAAVSLPARERWSHDAAGRSGSCGQGPSARHDARRRRGRGLRQGSAPARARLPRRRRDRPHRASGRRRRV